jgi:hypothetical protein
METDTIVLPARQHVVLMRFEPELTADDAAELRAQAAKLAADIDVIDSLRLGPTSLEPETANGYHYLMNVNIAGVDDAFNVYMTHPSHRAFGQWLSSHGAVEFLVFNYALDDTTIVK